MSALRLHLVENTGSTARDYCMLERNILSHVKLALLLSLLSSSLLLHARLVPQIGVEVGLKSGVPLASVLLVASLMVVAAGAWEYYSGYQDLRKVRAFLVATKPHLGIMTVVVGTIFATCIVLLINDT